MAEPPQKIDEKMSAFKNELSRPAFAAKNLIQAAVAPPSECGTFCKSLRARAVQGRAYYGRKAATTAWSASKALQIRAGVVFLVGKTGEALLFMKTFMPLPRLTIRSLREHVYLQSNILFFDLNGDSMIDESKSADLKSDRVESSIEHMKENPFITLPLQAYKTRRNMLLVASICFFQACYGQLGGIFTVFGNTLTFPVIHFNFLLICISAYFVSYFIMLCWPTKMEWQLRCTGISAMFWGDTPKKITAWQAIDTISEQRSKQAKELEDLMDRLSAFEATFWKHQKACWRSFYIWEFGGPLLLSACATVALLVKNIFDLF